MSLDDPTVQRAFAEASTQQFLSDSASKAILGNAPETVLRIQNSAGATDRNEIWTRPAPKPRGRAPNDPDGKKVTFRCQTIEDLENNLREYLSVPFHPPEHTTLEFHYGMEAAFLVAKVHLKSHMSAAEAHNAVFSEKTVVSVLNALSWSDDPKEMKYKQRAIAKACAEAIMRVDRYKYSYNNEWVSKEDQASRISYYCNDSTSNKMRSINAAKPNQGKRAGKPVYDCHGYIAIKFSAVKQNLEVSYRHVPIHKTYDERAPAPRRGSKRRRLMDMYHPEAAPKHDEEKSNGSSLVAGGEIEDAASTSKRSRGPSKRRKVQLIPVSNVTSTSTQDQLSGAPGTNGAHPPSSQRYPSPPPLPNPPVFQANQTLHSPLQGPHSQLQPRSQTRPNISTPVSRTLPRQTVAQKRASTLSAARMEIDLMRGRLAEAEALVHRLEAENGTPDQNQSRSQNRARRKDARGKKGRAAALAAAGGTEVEGDSSALGKRADRGGGKDAGTREGQGPAGLEEGNAPDAAWNIFTPATYPSRQRGRGPDASPWITGTGPDIDTGRAAVNMPVPGR